MVVKVAGIVAGIVADIVAGIVTDIVTGVGEGVGVARAPGRGARGPEGVGGQVAVGEGAEGVGLARGVCRALWGNDDSVFAQRAQRYEACPVVQLCAAPLHAVQLRAASLHVAPWYVAHHAAQLCAAPLHATQLCAASLHATQLCAASLHATQLRIAHRAGGGAEGTDDAASDGAQDAGDATGKGATVLAVVKGRVHTTTHTTPTTHVPMDRGGRDEGGGPGPQGRLVAREEGGWPRLAAGDGGGSEPGASLGGDAASVGHLERIVGQQGSSVHSVVKGPHGVALRVE